MPLHIKYRPSSLEEIEGNKETVNALASKLKSKDIPHAFLLTGNSGCGKTTIARIIKDKLGCAKQNYHEIDSADFRGIDSIRDIRRQMHLKGLGGGIRVWLLDECHQLSKDAQNALLKALEDTPAHVYFILATTDPGKLITTLQNRCTKFHVEPLSEDHMVKFLSGVVRKERKRVPQEVLKQIAIDSFGSPRTGLVILDKIIDLDTDDMKKAAEQQAQQENQSIELYQAILKKKPWKVIAGILRNLKEDPETIRIKGMFYFEAVLLNSGDSKLFDIMDCWNKPIYNEPKRSQLTYMCYDATTV